MGNQIKHRRLFRLATSWLLAFVLTGGSMPVPALQELFGTATAYAEEQQSKESTLEAVEKDSSQDSAREIVIGESQQDQDDAPTILGVSNPTEKDAITEEDEIPESEEPIMVLATEGDAERISTTQNGSEDDPSISFEGDVPNCLVVTDASDSVDLTLSTLNTQGLNIRWTVGLCVVDDWVNGHIFVENREYSVDQLTNTITLNGAKVLEHLGGYGEGSDPNRLHVRIFAEAIDPSDPDGNPVAANATTWVDFFEPYVDYENREQDRDMLPGWDGTVYRWYNARVYDVDHPDGENRDYEVMNVSSSDESVVKVERQEWGEGDDADHNWGYEAKDKGTATLTVTYRKVHSDETDSYTFDVTVASDVYDVEWETENTSLAAGNGSFMGLPGQSILIRARGIHHHEGADDSYDGFTYAWAFAEDGSADHASITDNADGTATVTFNPDTSYEDGQFLCADVNVRLTASKDGKDVERTILLDLENEYPEIWIQETDSTQLDDMEVGATQNVTPEVRFYVQDWSLIGLSQPYTLGKITRLNWDFDSNAVNITYNNGTTVNSGEGINIVDGVVPTFTITRLGDWDAEIALHADWEPTEDNGRFATEPADKEGDTIGWRHEQAHWNLRAKNYEIRFDGAPDRFVAGDKQATEELHLDWDSIMDIPGLQIAYTVGIWDGNDWTYRFTEDNEYTVDHYRNIVTLNGKDILNDYAGSQDEIEVRALAEVMSGDERLCDCDHFIKVMKPIARYDQEQDRDLLPGWDGDVSNRHRVWARDEDHVDGQDYDCRVTNVEVIDARDAENKKVDWEDLIELRKDYENDDKTNDEYWWHYAAKENVHGTATLEVTYNNPEELGGGIGQYTFDLNIVSDVYGLDAYVSTGDRWAMPGETIEFEAYGWHWHEEEDGRQVYYEAESDENDMRVEWALANDGDRYADLKNTTGMENTITMKALDERDFDYSFDVEARLYDGENGSEAAFDGERVAIYENRPTITPYEADFPFRTAQDGAFTITPKQLWRSFDDEGNTCEDDITDSANVHFDLRFNPDCVQVTGDGLEVDDADDGHLSWQGAKALTFKRTGNGHTDINLDSSWNNSAGDVERDSRSWWFDSQDYNVDFNDAPDCFVVTDTQSDRKLNLNIDQLRGTEGLDIVYTVGVWRDDTWEKTFSEGVEYSATQAVVTLHGTEILNHLAGDEDELTVCVRAEVKNGDTVLSDTDHWIRVLSHVERIDQDQERDLLPGWDGTVDERFNMWVRDGNHPDGEDFECIVTDVEVTAGADLIDFDSSTWHYRAKELGTATLKVTYQRPDDLGGGTGTYDFKLNIVADEYHFEGLGTQRHGGFILPGETADVWLQGYHQHAVKNDDGSWRIEESTDDLAYEWEMVPSRPEYDDIATMTVDENDPTHVTITAIVLEPEPRPGAGVTVSAHLKHDGEGVARAGWTINICDSFPDFEPAAIDCDLAVGESTTIDPKLMWRERHDDGEIVSEPFEPEGLQLFWSYDTDAVLITDAEGNVIANSEWGGNDSPAGEGPYTVTRLNDAEAMLCLMARWPEGENTMDYEAQYRFVAARDVTAHKLEHVVAKTATLSATGHGEHWKCKVCGKLFLDEDATQATTLKDLTIAKLTNISTATVTFPARTYNGSEQTTLPVVKSGNATLVKGTDYTVTGTTKATNAGTYEVTITGIGAYGGSRKVSYTVAKAASSISLAPQTKTYTGGALAYSGTVTKKGSTGAVSYAYYSDAACTKAVAAANVKSAGTYYVKGTVKADANHNAATSAAAKFTVAPKAQTISAANKSVAMGKPVSLGAKVTEGAGALSYKSSSTAIAKVSAKGIVTPVKVGSTTITVTAAAKGNYKSTSKTIKVTVTKGAQPIAVKALTAKVALSKVKKANQTLAVSKVLTVTKAQGAVTYAKTSGNAKITVNSKTGAVTVKKGLGKGTYSVKVKVKAAGNANWKAGTKTVTFYVSVK
ncbi:MAG: hypothetical protein IKG18_17885 [Atopobiaceae bacterium]|nr:hypothetical protein [Atopobiaceae bacterium]